MKGLQTILKEIRDAVRAATPIAGPGIRVTPQSRGTVVSAVPVEATAAGEAGTALVSVKIVSGTGQDHVCDVYGDGPDEAATAEDQDLKILMIHASTSIPVNTWLAAWYETWDVDGTPTEILTAEWFDLALITGYNAANTQGLMNLAGTWTLVDVHECGE